MPVNVRIIDDKGRIAKISENDELQIKSDNLDQRLAPLEWTNKFGYNSDVDTGAAGEDIWNAGGIWVSPTTDRIHNIVSTDTADTSTGTGAHSIKIVGLDPQGVEQTEEVILNGTTDVPTVKSYRRIFRMYTVTAGSNGINEGIITATALTDATVTASISIGDNQSLMAIYTIPNGKTGHMNNLSMTVDPSNNTTITVNLLSRLPAGVWRVKERFILTNSFPSHTIRFNPPKTFQEKEDVKLHVVTTANNVAIGANFDIQLVNN